MTNPYLELTKAFNRGRVRAILSSGQAVVVHRLAIMSKDGDWILREDVEALDHILTELDIRGGRYRFGAPLDVRWLRHGWSSHFEYRDSGLRLRCDFVTRPPRISHGELVRMWDDARGKELPVVDPENLAQLKKTNREKDYAVIGELARLMGDPHSQLLHSRSARDLLRLAEEHPDLFGEASAVRPALKAAWTGRDSLERALDRERRILMRQNEERLAAYSAAAQGWVRIWPDVVREIEGLPLLEAHRIVAARAEGALPFQQLEGNP